MDDGAAGIGGGAGFGADPCADDDEAGIVNGGLEGKALDRRRTRGLRENGGPREECRR